jgi:hypothetical protein
MVVSSMSRLSNKPLDTAAEGQRQRYVATGIGVSFGPITHMQRAG